MKLSLLLPPKIGILLFVLAGLLVGAGNVNAQRIASVSGNWSNTATWGGAAVPVSTDAVTINEGITVTVDINSAVCASVQIGTSTNTSAAVLLFSNGSVLTVGGPVTLGSASGNRAGTITMTAGGTLICNALALGGSGTKTFTPGTGTVQLAATNTLPTSIFTAFNNLTINAGTTTTSGVSFSVSGTLTVNGTFKPGATHIISGAGALTGTGTVQVTRTAATAGFLNQYTISNKTLTNLTVEYAVLTGSQVVSPTTYGSLKLDNTSGTNTAGGAVTVNGTLTTTSGGTLNMGTNQLLGSITPANSGTIRTQNLSNPAIPSGDNWGGTVTFDATTGAQFVPAGTYTNLKFSNTSGTQTAVGDITVNGTLTTTASGTLNMGTYQLLGSITAANSGTIRTQNLSTPAIPSGHNWGGTVTFDAATGAQFVPAGTYTNLKFSNTSGMQTAVGNLTVNGTLTTTGGGILNMGTNQLSGTLTTVTNGGAIQTQNTSATPIPTGKSWGGTVTYNASAGGQTVMAGTYINLTFGNTSGTQTAVGAITVNGALTTTSGGTLNMGANRLSGTLATIANGGTIQTQNTSATPIPNGKSWGGVFEYNGAAQTVATGTYNNLIFSGSGTKSIASGTSVTGNLSIAPTGSATANVGWGLTINVGTLTLGGVGAVNGYWGSTTATAAWFQDDTYFAATDGLLNVSASTCSPPADPVTTGALICIGTPNSTTLSASGAVAGQLYNWYDAATGGTLLYTSIDNTDNTYSPFVSSTTSYWVTILSRGGCESNRVQVTATLPAVSPDNQNQAGTNSWIGHVYKRADAVAGPPTDANAFASYYGNVTELESFNEGFGGAGACYSLNSAGSYYCSLYTEMFAIKYRMNSSKKGLYIADIGSDDGARLTVDGIKLYDQWIERAYISDPRILFNLSGNSNLLLEYYQSLGGNQISFQNLTQVLANNLSINLTQNICIGNSGTAISGDVYGTLPTGISPSGTGYQWTYSTTPGGARTSISGATGATFTPNAAAPFNAPGTYYLYRNAVLSSANNISPNPYVATNESNAATITIIDFPVAPAATNQSKPYTGTANTTAISATPGSGETIDWYAAASGGTAILSGNTSYIPVAVNAGTYTFYAEARNIAYGCRSTSRTPVSLTINRAALTITASNQSKTYGSTFNFVGTEFTSSGLQNGETVGSVTLNSTGAPATAAVNNYSIVPSAATGGTFTASNYNISYSNGTMTVNGKSLTITATGPAKQYGTALTAGTSTTNFTAAGAVPGEAVTSVTLAPDVAGLSSTTAAGAAYVVTPSLPTGTGGFLASNYSITYNAYNGTVSAAPLTVTASPQSKNYGATAPTSGTLNTNFTVSGLKNSDAVNGATLGYSGSPAGNLATAAVGSYTITPSAVTFSTGSGSNYTITYSGGTLTVNNAAITVTADAKSKNCGAADPALTYQITSGALVSGDSFSGSLTRVAGESTGNYAIQQGSLSLSGNYSLTFVGANFTIYDSTPPVFSGCPTSFSQNVDANSCSALGTWTIPTVTDNCSGNPTVVRTNTSGITFVDANHATVAVGTSTITYTATDASANSSTCSFTITVTDNIAPTIACPSGSTVFCAANAPAYSNYTDFTSAGGSATDNCNLNISSFIKLADNLTGSTLSRTYSIADMAGNTATCTQVFTISQPTVTISSLGLNNTCPGVGLTISSSVTGYGGTVHYQWQLSTNSGTSWLNTGSDLATFTGTLGSLGDQYRLLVSQTTNFGQAACNAISNVLTFVDVTKPYFTAFAPANQTVCTVGGATTASVNGIRITNIDVTDNCTSFNNLIIAYTITGATTGSGSNLAEGYSFAVGTSTVAYTVTDLSGNSATHTFTITVNQSPAAITMGSSVVSGGGTGVAPNQCGDYRYYVVEDALAPQSGNTYTWKVYVGAGTSGTQLTAGTDYQIDNSTSPYHAASVKISWPGSLMPGIYTIEVAKANANCNSRATMQISLQNRFNLTVNDPGQDCKGETLGSKTINWQVARTCGTTAYTFTYVIAAGQWNTLADAQTNKIAGMPVTVTNTIDNPKIILQTVDYGTGGNFYTTQVFTLFIYNQLDANGQPDINAADDYQYFYLKAIPNVTPISTN